MYVLILEGKIQIFDKKTSKWRYDSALSEDYIINNVNDFEIIIDRNFVDFSLEHLNNCSFMDAYNILNCRLKILGFDADVSLVKMQNIKYFTKSHFILQSKILKQHNEKFANLNNGIFLIEDIVAEFCIETAKINEYGWWLYIALHSENSLRIIVGIGNGILLSRFLTNDFDPLQEVKNTIIYLRRFGLNSELTIISNLHELSGLKNYFFIKNLECNLINFLSKNKKIKKSFVRKSQLTRVIESTKMHIFLLAILLFLLHMFCSIYDEIVRLKHDIHTLCPLHEIETNQIVLYSKSGNFNFANQLIDKLKCSPNPISVFAQVWRFCKSYQINIEKLSMENGALVRIKTKLFLSEINKIKAANNKNIQITFHLQKLNKLDYESIENRDIDEKNEVILCIKFL